MILYFNDVWHSPSSTIFWEKFKKFKMLMLSKTFAVFQRCSYYIKLLTNLLDIIRVYFSYKTTPAWFIVVNISVPLYTTWNIFYYFPFFFCFYQTFSILKWSSLFVLVLIFIVTKRLKCFKTLIPLQAQYMAQNV